MDGILSMYGPDGGVVLDLIPKYLAMEGKPAVPYLVSLVEARLEQKVPPEAAARVAPIPILLYALGEIRDERALAVLEKAMSKREGLSQQDQVVQSSAAASALASFHSVKALDALIRGLGNDNTVIYTDIAEAIQEASRGLAGVDPVRRVLEAAAKDKTLVRGAIEAVALLGGPLAVDFLHDLLRGDDEPNRMRAVQFLPKLAPQEAGEWILPLLHDPSLRVQKEACTALGQVKMREAIPEIIGLMESNPDPGLHGNAVWALRQITGQVLKDDASLWRRWWEGNKDNPPHGK